MPSEADLARPARKKRNLLVAVATRQRADIGIAKREVWEVSKPIKTADVYFRLVLMLI